MLDGVHQYVYTWHTPCNFDRFFLVINHCHAKIIESWLIQLDHNQRTFLILSKKEALHQSLQFENRIVEFWASDWGFI